MADVRVAQPRQQRGLPQRRLHFLHRHAGRLEDLHRLAAELRLQSTITWLGDVAQEPPRSTYWLHMNLPLYSPNAPSTAE